MAVGSHTFTKISSLTILQGDSYPFTISRRLVQASEETAGGKLYVHDRNTEIAVYELLFERITKVEKDLLDSIYRFEVSGSFETLNWNDIEDVNRTVRIMNNPLVFTEVGHDGNGPVYNVLLTLREEIP